MVKLLRRSARARLCSARATVSGEGVICSASARCAWIQAEQVARTLQIAVLGSRGVRVDEESAQGYKSGAQGGAPLLGPTVRPQEGGQLAAGVHAAFDRQVEQQGLGLAQGKGEAAAITKYFWWAEHGQS